MAAMTDAAVRAYECMRENNNVIADDCSGFDDGIWSDMAIRTDLRSRVNVGRRMNPLHVLSIPIKKPEHGNHGLLYVRGCPNRRICRQVVMNNFIENIVNNKNARPPIEGGIEMLTFGEKYQAFRMAFVGGENISDPVLSRANCG